MLEEVAPYEYDAERLKEAAYARLRALKIEPPTPGRVERLIRSALRSYDERFCETTLERLSENSIVEMDALLSEPEVPEETASEGSDGCSSGTSGREKPTLARLRNDPGRASAESARTEIAKLSRLRGIGLPEELFADVSSKVVRSYRRRAASESPSTELYTSAQQAKSSLALPRAPEVRVEFRIRNEPALKREAARVSPSMGEPGGGTEYMTTERVHVEVIQVDNLDR